MLFVRLNQAAGPDAALYPARQPFQKGKGSGPHMFALQLRSENSVNMSDLLQECSRASYQKHATSTYSGSRKNYLSVQNSLRHGTRPHMYEQDPTRAPKRFPLQGKFSNTQAEKQNVSPFEKKWEATSLTVKTCGLWWTKHKTLTLLLLEVIGQAVVLQHSKVPTYWKNIKHKNK